MFNLITIGDATVDTIIIIDEDEAKLQCDLNKENCLLCLNYADKISIRNTAQAIGGNAANVAVGCEKLGLKTTIATELGDDINGYFITEELKKNKVNTDLVKILPNKETRYAVILNYQSERTILSYQAERNYCLPNLPATDWIYYTSLAKSFENIQDALAKHLAKHPSIKLAVNPGSYQLKYGLQKIKELLPSIDLLFVNKQEAEKISGTMKTMTALIQTFHNAGVKKIVITDGTNGSYASANGENKIYFMSPYPIKPIGRTGAGDAYASGFLSAIIQKQHLTEAMQWGTANAGGVIQKIGAQKGLLNKAGIENIIKTYSKIKPKLMKSNY